MFMGWCKREILCDKKSFTLLVIIDIILLVIEEYMFVEHIYNSMNDWPFIIASVSMLSITGLSILLCYRINDYHRRTHDLEMNYVITEKTKDQISELNQYSELLASIRHDLNQQISVAKLMKFEDDKESAEFLDELMSKLPKVFNTGNLSVDSLLSFKVFECKKKGISFEYQLCNIQDFPLSNVGLISVLGNVLNNAIEAQGEEKNPQKQKWIRLYIKRSRNMWFIKCVNSVFDKIMEDDNGGFYSKKRRDQHGYGIRNIKSKIDQAKGISSFVFQNGTFIVELLIPASEETQQLSNTGSLLS